MRNARSSFFILLNLLKNEKSQNIIIIYLNSVICIETKHLLRFLWYFADL